VPTLNAVLAALERHVGFPESRSRGIARRLQDAGMLPLGAPGLAPQLDVDDVTTLLIGVATDAGLRTTADTTRHYSDLVPGGAEVTGAPASLTRTAHDHLAVLIDHAAHGDPAGDLTSGTLIDFCTSWPEVTFTHRDGTAHRYQPVGSLPDHWQGGRHRRAVTINGAALSDAVQNIFWKE
jgi:hypothetical protein